ncbi:MAG: HD domain-containing protein [Dethiobacteria bacterium]
MTETKKQLIGNLKVGSEVETQVLVVEANLANYSSPNRAGEQFWRLILGDISGTIKGIIWDTNILGEALKEGDILYIKGDVSEYHGLQVIIREAKKLDPEHINRRLFQPVSKRDIPEMLKELKEIITTEVSNPFLQKLLRNFFSDRDFVKRFAGSPAAKTIHHNYIGGLLEHTLEVVSLCLIIKEMYPDQFRTDLLVTGAILHDVGKIEEYDADSFNFDLTDKGKLIGHICLGKELLNERIAAIEGFPSSLKLELEHIILTHHGQREWGSPEIPKTIHAFAVFYADLLSARLNQFVNVMQKNASAENDWSEWDRYLERSIYLKKS